MPEELEKHDEPTKIPLDFGQAVEGLLGVKWDQLQKEESNGVQDMSDTKEIVLQLTDGELQVLKRSVDEHETNRNSKGLSTDECKSLKAKLLNATE